jgi:hypothetical protein
VRVICCTAAIALLSASGAVAGSTESTNRAPRITKATLTRGTSESGPTAEARITVCDDSLGIFEGGTENGPGRIVIEERLFRGRTLWGYLRTEDFLDFAPGCHGFRMGWLVNDIFSPPGSYRVTVSVRDPEGRPSNKISKVWKLR